MLIESAWRADSKAISANFEDDARDASLLQLLDLRFLTADDPMFTGTLEALTSGQADLALGHGVSE